MTEAKMINLAQTVRNTCNPKLNFLSNWEHLCKGQSLGFFSFFFSLRESPLLTAVCVGWTDCCHAYAHTDRRLTWWLCLLNPFDLLSPFSLSHFSLFIANVVVLGVGVHDYGTTETWKYCRKDIRSSKRQTVI